MQVTKPKDRTKDIIAYSNKNDPSNLDRTVHKGCDTLWKCFKRTVWRTPDNYFLGEREQISQTAFGKYTSSKNEGKLGQFIWQTWGETDLIVEALANTIIKKEFCPVIKSNVEGTPDMKMMAIFSENRSQWFMTELACCSDSICIVPIAREN